MSRSTLPSTTPRPESPAEARTGPLLVAVGGAHPDSVVRAARLLAAKFPGGVLAISVLEPLPVYGFTAEPAIVSPGFEDERRETLMTRLAAQVREVAAPATWSTSVVYGDPPSELAALARTTRAPLIVMGIGRHRPMDRLLAAETTLRTIRRAPCPVLAVHPELSGAFRNIVVATDFSPESAYAADYAIRMLAADDATVHIAHVWRDGAGLAEADEAYASSLQERFRRFKDLLPRAPRMTIESSTRVGRAAQRLVELATDRRADLIVAGRHGLGTFQRILVGSVTTAIVRGAECSVLVAPEPPFAEFERLRRLLTGTSTSTEPEEWKVQLEAFGRRNHGRRTLLELDDAIFGAQVTESGYRLLGTVYDARDRRLEIRLGDLDRSDRFVTRGIGLVDSVTVVTDPQGRDVGLRIAHAGGQTVLTLAGD